MNSVANRNLDLCSPNEAKQEQRWYAIAVYARQEKSAQRELESLGLEAFLPLATQRRLWSDRVKRLQLALFPGYLFVRTVLDAEMRFRILRPKQVIDLVGRRRDQPEIIAQSVPTVQVESLKLLIAQRETIEPTYNLVKGAEIKIVQGPLKGAVGIIEREPNGQRRIVVQVPLLGRGIRADLHIDDVFAIQDLPN